MTAATAFAVFSHNKWELKRWASTWFMILKKNIKAHNFCSYSHVKTKIILISLSSKFNNILECSIGWNCNELWLNAWKLNLISSFIALYLAAMRILLGYLFTAAQRTNFLSQTNYIIAKGPNYSWGEAVKNIFFWHLYWKKVNICAAWWVRSMVNLIIQLVGEIICHFSKDDSCKTV